MTRPSYTRLVCFIGVLLHCSCTCAQTPYCSAQGYDYRTAFNQVHGYLMKGNQWEYFSDASNYREVFSSKAQFRKTSQLEIIPARRFLAPADFTAPGDSIGWAAWFQPDYNQFLAFLAYKRTLVALLVSSPQTYHQQALPGNMGVDSSVDPAVLFRTFYAPGVCLFYDTQLRTYAYVKNGSYWYWSYSLHRFSAVRGLAGYRDLCRTGVQ